MAEFLEETDVLANEEEGATGGEGDISLETGEDPVSVDGDAVTENLIDGCLLQELEAIKARVRQMEEEAEKLKQMQSEVDKQMTSPTVGSPMGSNSNLSVEEKMEVDAR